MNWDHLRVFLAVAREGQLLSAARHLGLTHATVARRLDALEAALGARLFDRRPQGSALTSAGRALLPRAERIEADILDVADTARTETANVSGTVRIGAPDGLGSYFLPAVLGELSRLHPRLSIELVPLPRRFSLSKREADIAVTLDNPAEGRLVGTRLGDYSLSVYASRGYLAANGAPALPTEIGDHVLVTGVKAYAYAAALDYTHKLEEQANRIFRCAGVIAQAKAVEAGIGIGVLHDFAVGGDPNFVRILPEIRFRRTYHLLAYRDTHRLARVALCWRHIIRRFRNERARFLPA